jgi:hypothetical protein
MNRWREPRPKWRPFPWSLVDGIYGLLQFVRKPWGRSCGVCRTRVKRGLTACPKCGQNLAHQHSTSASTSPDRIAETGGIPEEPAQVSRLRRLLER